jgi:hypothetical protein
MIRYSFISFISHAKFYYYYFFQRPKKSSLNPQTQEEREREKGSEGREEGLERNKRDSVPTNRFKWR